MITGWKLAELREFWAEKGIKWRFTTLKAPHHNGCTEASVKTCKKALKKSIGNQVQTTFEFYTYLMEEANLVNSWPIGRVPNDPDDGAFLSPNDMLLGRAISEVLQGPFRQTKNPRHRVEFVKIQPFSLTKKLAAILKNPRRWLSRNNPRSLDQLEARILRNFLCNYNELMN